MRNGAKNQALISGRIVYGSDGTDVYAMKVDSSGNQQIELLAGTASIGNIGELPQREPFIFRPGSSALASSSATTGMVLSGVRSGGATVASTSADTTVWGTEVVYEPARDGKIDGLTTGGIISGQLTIGTIAAAATCLAKHTARIRNKSGTTTTCLFLSGTVAVGATTEVYTTYDIPYLQTTATFNAIPFGIAIGVQSNEAGTAAVARIMESSYIMGEFEPGT